MGININTVSRERWDEAVGFLDWLQGEEFFVGSSGYEHLSLVIALVRREMEQAPSELQVRWEAHNGFAG